MPGSAEPIMVKVVARYPDGRVVKGHTADFSQFKEHFHIRRADAPGDAPQQIRLSELKAVFFVKDLQGDLGHAKSNLFDPDDRTPGRKVRVQFQDGEELWGFSPDYLSSRPAFFVLPADLLGNIDRCFVITSATRKVSLIP